MFRNIALLVGGLASLCPVALPAQEAVLGQKYGHGVHAYFAGDYPDGVRAIDHGHPGPDRKTPASSTSAA